MDTDRTAGPVALVTGAGQGIGAAIVRDLAANGLRVVATDVAADRASAVAEAAKSEGLDITGMALDVTDSASCDAVTREVAGKLGSLDVLVNCAGWVSTQPFVEDTVDYWRQVLDVNLLGVIQTTRAAVEIMTPQQSGSIVNIVSEAGRIGTPRQAVYAGSKGGVVAFSKSIAREVARHGIRVNCVSPGITRTPLLEEQDDDAINRMLRGVPMRRLAEPSDIANAVTFMASSRASFITGEVLSVSGGLSMVG